MGRLIAVAAGKGAPGVTTTAVALALGWPREVVLAEVDPAGGDLVWQARLQSGAILDPQRGVVSLTGAMQVAHGPSGRALTPHLQVLDGGLPVLAGPAGPEQAAAIGAGWERVADALQAVEPDVIADCGRLMTTASWAAPVVRAADLVVLVARPRVESVAHLRHGVRMAAELLNSVPGGGSGLARVGVVVVDETARPWSRRTSQRSVTDVLAATPGLGDVPVLGVLAWDPRSAAAVGGRVGMPPRSRLLATARRCAADLEEMAAMAELTAGSRS